MQLKHPDSSQPKEKRVSLAGKVIVFIFMANQGVIIVHGEGRTINGAYYHNC